MQDIDRLSDFLLDSDPEAALSTAALIQDAIAILARHPLIGRPASGDLREFPISRGHTGYLALYVYDEVEDEVIVIGVRHQREAGFHE